MQTTLATTPTSRFRRPAPLGAAGLLALAGASSAVAQVVYVDPPDLPLPPEEMVPLDVDADGSADASFAIDPDGSIRIAGYAVGWQAGGGLYADRLDPGQFIDIEAGWVGPRCDDSSCAFPVLSSTSIPACDWTPGQQGLLGLAYAGSSGLIHFAWVRLRTPAPGIAGAVEDWAYQATPFTGLAAADEGEPPCPPVIVDAPRPANPLVGDPTVLSVRARGQSLTFQWFHDGVPLSDAPGVSGSNDRVLTLLDTRPADAGTYTVEIGSRCGTVTAPPIKLDVTPDCPPFPGRALSLDGLAGLASIPDAPALDLGHTATFEAWFRPAAGAPGARLLSKGDGIDAFTDRALDITYFTGEAGGPGMLVAEFFLGPAYADRNRIAVLAPQSIAPETWTHVAATLNTDLAACRLYINGRLAAETSVLEDGLTPIPALDLRHSTYPLNLGASPPWSYLRGRLDDVRVWSTARTPEEIASSYHTALDPASPGLVAWFRFDEGDGARDSAGANHGTLAAGASLVFTHPCCPADFNGDDFIDFFDYDEFVACFESASCPVGTDADFNHDGFVDFFDYDEFVAAFERGC